MMTEQNLKRRNPSRWSRRTRLEKYLILLAALLIATMIVILCIKLVPQHEGDICFTPECVKTAADVLQRIDLRVNPCDDFYMFACGNFVKDTFIPDYKTSINSFSIVSDMVEEQIRTILNKPIEDTEARPFLLAKSIYQACMNTTNVEAHSLPTLQRIFRTSGGWPVVEGSGWNENSFDWRTTTYKFMQLGFDFDIFFSFDVSADPRNSSRKSLSLDQPYIVSFDKLMHNGLNESLVQAYYNYMVKIAMVFGADKQKAIEEMRDVIDLDIEMTRITVPPEERRDTSAETNPMTIKKLEEEFSYVHWLHFINTMLHPVKMTSDDDVIVTVPKYFKRLGNLLNGTPKRTLANYMYWKVVKSQIKYLNDDLRNLKLQFSKIASGRSERTPRWKECTDEATGLQAAIGALFVRHFFKKEGKKTMLELVGNIRHQFKEILKSVDWMDVVTKKHALGKADAMEVYIAYPEELLDDKEIDRYYQNLTLDRTKYLESMQNLSLFRKQVEYSELDMPVNKSDWRKHFYASLTNAFYDENENSIEFPAAILQGVFFDSDRPQYMNYGAIGYIIGHEITHGFDDEGRQFDKNGNLVDWWQSKTKKAFDEKAQCIVDQYNNFTVPEINIRLNGINTQGENIADNGGVKQAYMAYKKWSKEHTRELKLPGLPYTPEQMFWISAGNTWCSVDRKEQLKIDVMGEYHAPSYYRVNVPLMNSEYFSKDFNCPPGSNMNPKHKCVVW